ncbi:hypothetical protein ABMX98_21540, partial [Vibrio vulnificus]
VLVNNRANKAFKSDSQRLAVSLRSSITKRRSHLNAALCFNHEKSVGCIFSLLSRLSNFGLVGKLAFGGRCFLDSYSWARKIQRIASLKFSAFVIE